MRGQKQSEIAPHDEHFVFHVARHTCATMLANNQNVNTVLIGTILIIGLRLQLVNTYIQAGRLHQILNELKVPSQMLTVFKWITDALAFISIIVWGWFMWLLVLFVG